LILGAKPYEDKYGQFDRATVEWVPQIDLLWDSSEVNEGKPRRGHVPAAPQKQPLAAVGSYGHVCTPLPFERMRSAAPLASSCLGLSASGLGNWYLSNYLRGLLLLSFDSRLYLIGRCCLQDLPRRSMFLSRTFPPPLPPCQASSLKGLSRALTEYAQQPFEYSARLECSFTSTTCSPVALAVVYGLDAHYFAMTSKLSHDGQNITIITTRGDVSQGDGTSLRTRFKTRFPRFRAGARLDRCTT
jgi:hypothetical protein